MNKTPYWTILPLLSFLWGSIAYAQIEEIVVTAQRRPENIQDVPISISAFDGDFLVDSGVYTLQALGDYTPNLTLSQSSQVANQRIIMRGVGSVGNNAIEPSVAVFIDGVYYPRPASVVRTLTDLELVEVLRGQQGTLFGRNASMGALNIKTKRPTESLEGHIRGSYGNFDAIRLSGTVSNSLSEQTSGRLSFHYGDRGGIADNTFSGVGNDNKFGDREDINVRGKLTFLPTDRLDINLSVDYARVENQGSIIEVLSDTVLPSYTGTLSVVLNPLGPVPGGDVPETEETFDYSVNQDHRDNGEDEQWGGVLDINWSVNDHNIRSITSYRDWQNDTFESALRLPADLLNRVTNYQNKTVSQEVQLLSPAGGFLEYVAGIYYYSEDYDIDQSLDLGADFCQAVNNLVTASTMNPALGATAQGQCDAGPLTDSVTSLFSQELTSLALFGQVTVNFTEFLRFTGGLRWTDDSKDGSFDQQVPNIIMLPPSLNPLGINLRTIDVAPDLQFDDDRVTWLANVSYDINDNIMVFATGSSGFKSGGFNSEGANVVIERIFASEKVLNFEFGVKSYLFQNRMIANLTFFNTEIDNFQDRQFDGVNFIVQNTGKLTQQGLELDIQMQPTENLFIVGGLPYLDSSFDSSPDATALPGVIAGLPGDNPQDLTGERNHFSPKWQGSVVAEYSDDIGDTDFGWYLRGEYQHIGSQNIGAETNQNPQSIQNSYDLINARAGFTGSDEQWEIAVFGRNLTDKGYCQTIFNQPIGITLGLVDPATLGGMQRCVVGAPRSYGLEGLYRF